MAFFGCRFIPVEEAENVISSNGSALPSRTSIPDVTAPSARKSASITPTAAAQPSLAEWKKSEEVRATVKVGCISLHAL